MLPTLKKGVKTTRFKYEMLRDPKAVKSAVLKCLGEGNDAEAQEILHAHCELVNKTRLADKAGVTRRTFYKVITVKSDPKLSSVAKVLAAL